jgi:hypothetical protein
VDSRTAEKLIALVRNLEFDSKEVDSDLHKRMEKAVLYGSIKCFNTREGPADWDQDLNAWFRELEDVRSSKAIRKYSFEMDLDEAGKQLYGGKANAGVAFQVGQSRYII